MTDTPAKNSSNRIEDEIRAYREAEKPKRENRVVVFVTLFIIVFGLLALFLVTTNQNIDTGEESSLSEIDQTLAANLRPLEERLKKDPKDVQAMVEIGFLYFEAGSYREAIKHFNHANMTDAKNVDALIGLGMSYQAVGRRDEAGPLFDKALEIDPDNTFAKVRKAYLLANENKEQEALDLLRQVEASEPDLELKAAATKAIDEIEKKFKQ